MNNKNEKKISKKALIAVLPLIAAAAMSTVGGTVALWVFNKLEKTQTVGANVTTKVEGNITVVTDLELILDQPVTTLNPKGTDIHWTGSITPTLNLTNKADAISNYDLTWTLSADDFTPYVSFSALSGTWESGTALALPTVSYVDAGVATDEAKYDTMNAALEGKQLTFTFQAAIKA